MRVVTNSATGQSYKLGRRAPRARQPRLSLHRYFEGTLPVPPATGHYSRYAQGALGDPYLNTELGDCVVAGPLHALDVFLGGAGAPPPRFTRQQVVELYSAIGGYDPSKTAADGTNPTDQGCDEQTMLNYWQETGLCGHKIAGWVAVKPEQAKLAMWLFENLIFGVCLPDAWVSPMPAATGYVWDVAGPPVQENGHCFVGVGWNANGIIVDSWGLMGTVTYGAVQKYLAPGSGGELYTVVSPEAVAGAARKAPNGFNWEQLVADFGAIGGHAAA